MVVIRNWYIEKVVKHSLSFMFSPPKLSLAVREIKNICLHFFTFFCLSKPSNNRTVRSDKTKWCIAYGILRTLAYSFRANFITDPYPQQKKPPRKNMTLLMEDLLRV